MIQTLIQSQCQIVSHQEQRLIGICQNAYCDQISRRVCMKCVNEQHQKHKDFQFSDIITFEELDNHIYTFKKDILERNANMEKQCRINRFLLLKEIQQYVQFWQQRYKEYEYNEQIVQQINEKIQKITMESYLNQESQRTSIEQFFQELCQRDQNNIELILAGLVNISERQKIKFCKNDMIDNINDVINKMQESILQSTQMSIQEMYKFMIIDKFNQIEGVPQKLIQQGKIDNENLQQTKELQILNAFEKFHYFFIKHIAKEVPQQLKKLRIFDINAKQEYNQHQICRMGDLYNCLGLTDKSIKYYNQLIDLQPQNPILYIKKANIMRNQKNQKGAMECLNQCIKINPNYEDAYTQKAQILSLQQGQIKEAIGCLDQCIKINPNFGDAYREKARILRDQRKQNLAIECLDICIKINPNYEDAYSQKAQILSLQQGQIKEAIGCLDQCIKINPNFGDAYREKARILRDQRQQNLALECLDQCIKVNPNFGDAYLEKAWILKRQQGQMAIECLDLCIQVNPNFGDAYREKAGILKDQGQQQLAIECLDQCIKVKPNFGDAYLEKACILNWQQGKLKLAIKCLDLCIQVNPNFEDAQREKDLILKGQSNEALK